MSERFEERFELVKHYLMDLDLRILKEDADDELVIVDDPENGINNMVIDCEYPILILEQFILDVPSNPGDLFKRLLQMNRALVHGAFVLTDDASAIHYRDTLQLANLDANELEGSIQSLSLALAEFGAELLRYAKQ